MTGTMTFQSFRPLTAVPASPLADTLYPADIELLMPMAGEDPVDGAIAEGALFEETRGLGGDGVSSAFKFFSGIAARLTLPKRDEIDPELAGLAAFASSVATMPGIPAALAAAGIEYFASDVARLAATGADPSSSQPAPIAPGKVQVTKHGTILVDTKRGKIVFRPLVSTVKDLFSAGNIRLVVLPDEPLIDISQGTPRAEQEGLTYFFFFIASKMKGQTPFAVSKRVAPYADIILKNSYEGPQEPLTDEVVAQSYPQGTQTPGFPHLEEERAHWRTVSLDKMRQYHVFGDDGVLEFEEVKIIDRGDGVYVVYEDGELLGKVDTKKYPVPGRQEDGVKVPGPAEVALRQRILVDGEPAIVPINSGSLFSGEETSGHMIFRNGRAIVIDPSIDIMEWLEANGVPADVIDEVVITHVHVDHVAGAYRLLSRLPHRVTLAADPIVERQFAQMYRAMTLGQVGEAAIRNMWDFHPIRMLEPWQSVNGLWFAWRHGFHSIPPIGYVLYSGHPDEEGSHIAASFSGDSQIDPAVVTPLMAQMNSETGRAVISGLQRFLDITTAPLTGALAGGISLIDCGVRPLHPGLGFVSQLVRAHLLSSGGRIIGYHEADGKVQAEGITHFGSGIGDAISLARFMGWSPSPTLPHGRRENVARQALLRVPIFATGLSSSELEELTRLGRIVAFDAGKNIIDQGTQGKTMYVIVDGRVGVYKNNELIVTRSSGLFGETAVTTGKPRNATVTAETRTILIEFNGAAIQSFLSRTGIVGKLINLAAMRERSLHTFTRAALIKDLDPDTKDAILLHSETTTFSKGEVIIREGDDSKDVYIILDGEVDIYASSGPLSESPITMGADEIVGEMAVVTGEARSATVTASSDRVMVLKIPSRELDALIKLPQIRAMFLALTAERKAGR